MARDYAALYGEILRSGLMDAVLTSTAIAHTAANAA
jgi:hypothetical protein